MRPMTDDTCNVRDCHYGEPGWAGRLPCQQNWAGSPEAQREYLRECAQRQQVQLFSCPACGHSVAVVAPAWLKQS
jgi:hypothetical protein